MTELEKRLLKSVWGVQDGQIIEVLSCNHWDTKTLRYWVNRANTGGWRIWIDYVVNGNIRKVVVR